MASHRLRYSVLDGCFAVCKMATDSALPEWASKSRFFSATRTADELSLVCAEQAVPIEIQAQPGWACIQFEGPFPFAMTGVLASILNPLAEAEVGIFAISTYDTDYVLVQASQLGAAEEALQRAGHARLAARSG